MERIDRYPIKNKLILMIMSTTVISIFIVGSVLVVFDQYKTKQVMTAHLTTLGRIIADRSTAALSFDDPKAATDILSALSKEPLVLFACTYDRSNGLFVSYPSGEAVACPTETLQDGYQFTEAYFQLYQSVTLEEEIIGTIYIQATLGDLHARFLSYIFTVILIAILASFVAYILANRQQALISTPILRLTDIAKQISSGAQYDIQVPQGTGDEIGTLYRAFKKMLDQIAYREKARDQAEQLRRESENQVRLLLSSTAEAIYSLDLEGNCTFVNPACLSILGYESVSELLGKNMHSTIHYAHADGSPYPLEHCSIFEAFSTGKHSHSDSEVLWRSDGTSFQAEYWSHPIYKENQNVGFVVTFIDISERKRSEAALRQSEEKWRSLTQYSPDYICTLNREGIIQFINQAVPSLTPEEMIGKTQVEYLPEKYRSVALACYQQVLDTGVPNQYETEFCDPEGKNYYFEMQVGPIRDQEEIIGLTVSARDLTERKKSEEKLHQLAAVVQNTAEGVIVTDAAGKIITVNNAFTVITGYPEEEVLGQNPRFLNSKKHDRGFYTTLWATIDTAGFWQGEIWDRRKTGEIFPTWSTISSVKDSDGKLVNYVSVFSDISSIKRSQEKLDFLAHHDPLTELPNRLLFNDRLRHALKRALRESKEVAVIFLDLDRFKNINDSLGHPIGDILLQEAAERIMALVRSEDTVARLGGDEFIILIEEVSDIQGIAQLAQKIVDVFDRPFLIKEHELHLTVSAGISLYPDDGEDGPTLVKNADAAMYRAKEEGRNDYQFYTKALTTAVFERLTLETKLRHAVKNKELVLHYQPQYLLATGEIIGAEALVRWQHPDMGLVMPAKFIPLAEESGLIVAIGKWVLHEACRQMKCWVDANLSLKRIAVNLSGIQFQRGNIVATIKHTLDQIGLSPQRLELEITEGLIMQKTDRAISMLTRLQDLGITIAIDDFGTGYSSLSYLKQLPVDKLKIDRSFVRDITHDANDEAITRAVVALGQSLQLKVIAEGVETEEQRKFLENLGCDESQGNYYSPAVPAEEFLKLFKVIK